MEQTPRHSIRKRQDTIYNNRRNILINYCISAIRLPDFVTQEDFDWAVAEATRKKKIDCSRAELLIITEGEFVQIMHIGSYDDEPASVALMDDFLKANHYINDLTPPASITKSTYPTQGRLRWKN